MREKITWTDDQLLAHLAEWNKAIADGTVPRVTFRTAMGYYGEGHTILLPDGNVITLSSAQAEEVNRWIRARSGMLVQLRPVPPTVTESAPSDEPDNIKYGKLSENVAIYHDESWGGNAIGVSIDGRWHMGFTVPQFLALLDWGATYRKAIERLEEPNNG